MKKIFLFLVFGIVLTSILVHGQADAVLIRISLLNQAPNPARAGDTVDLRFKVENTGGKPVSSLDIEVVQDYPFTVVSGESLKALRNIGGFQSGDNYINLEYTIKIDKDAVQGQRQLQLRYRYLSGVWETVSFSVNIMSKEFAQIIYVDKAKLNPGKETDLKFTIINTGNAPLQNMIFSWNEVNGVILPVFSSDTRYVKYLDVGESVDLTYKVIADVNAKPGLYQLNLNLRSESINNASSTIISTKAGIFIGGETDFDVAFSEGSQGQTSLSVANTGNNPAQSVSVKIPQQENYRVSGTNSAIIGNLDKGDYTIVSFQIVSSANFSGFTSQRRQQTGDGTIRPRINASSNQNTLKVVIDYTDTTGERRSVEKNVPIQFRPTTTTGTITSFGRTSQRSSFIVSFTFWIVLVIGLVAGYFVLRNKSRRDKIMGIFRKKR